MNILRRVLRICARAAATLSCPNRQFGQSMFEAASRAIGGRASISSTERTVSTKEGGGDEAQAAESLAVATAAAAERRRSDEGEEGEYFEDGFDSTMHSLAAAAADLAAAAAAAAAVQPQRMAAAAAAHGFGSTFSFSTDDAAFGGDPRFGPGGGSGYGPGGGRLPKRTPEEQRARQERKKNEARQTAREAEVQRKAKLEADEARENAWRTAVLEAKTNGNTDFAAGEYDKAAKHYEAGLEARS